MGIGEPARDDAGVEDARDPAMARIADIERRAQVVDTQFQGIRLRWRRVGAGPHLLLIHGGQGSWLHWVRNIDALAASFTLWLPDLPGLGESGDVPEPITIDSLVAPLRHGLDTLVGPGAGISIAAFSFGASPAARLAVERGNVARFAMIGGTGHGLPRRTADLRRWKGLPPGPEQDDAHRHNLSQQMLRDPKTIDTLALVVHRQAMQQARLRSRPLSRSTVTRESLDHLSIPILMLWGEHDVTAQGQDTARALADGHPNRQWQVVPGAGHWLQYERSDLVNPLFLQWFKSA